MNTTYLRQLLLSNSSQLLITAEGLSSAMMEAFPLLGTPTSFFFNPDPPTYKDESGKALAALQADIKADSELKDVMLTNDFTSCELPEGTIAYHRIFGIVTSGSRWYFSSKQFEKDLLAAEANPAIDCHFLHVNTPGGEAWYLDRLSETMRSLSKPIMTLVECSNCSAGYYISCHSNYIAALTANDRIGCIGTMMTAYDYSEYYAKLGIKEITVKSTQSDLKNKKYEDVRKGSPEQYVEEELNPMSEQFISAVKAARSVLSTLDDNDPVFRGETFMTPVAIEKGLIDETMSFIQAIAKAVELGNAFNTASKIKREALNYL